MLAARSSFNGGQGPLEWRSILTMLITGLLAGGAGSILTIMTTSARLEERVTVLERDHRDMTARINDIDARGSRALPIIESRIKIVEDTLNARTKLIEQLLDTQRNLTPLEQANFMSIQRDLQRIEQRQDRIVQAIDSTYSLLEEHLRGNQKPPQPPKLNLDQPKTK